jgi:hypothetical protein
MGQRRDTLAALQQAALIRPGVDLRTEAILALSLPELRLSRDNLTVRANNTQALAFDLAHDRFTVEVQPGNWELRELADNLSIPIIASGGAGRKEHFRDTFIEGHSDAALAASVFHFGEIPIPELKQYLKSEGINVRI